MNFGKKKKFIEIFSKLFNRMNQSFSLVNEKFFNEIQMQQFSMNDYENDFLIQSSKNRSNTGYYDDDYEGGNKNKKKFGSLLRIFSILAISGLSIASIVGFSIYFLKNNNPTNNSSSNNVSAINKYYQKNNDTLSQGAMKYIMQRTFSVQFIFQKTNSNELQVVSGTSWIFSKNKSSDTYYCATNLHVAASLSYENKVYSEGNGQLVDFSGYKIKHTYVGFIDENQSNQLPVKYVSTDLNMLRVANPKLGYIASQKNDPNGFGSQYSKENIGATSHPNTYASLDFAILEFDFSKLSLELANQNGTISNYSNVSKFLNWLKIYNTNPTTFYSQQILIDDKIKNFPRLYMGGFPSTENENGSYAPSYSDSFANYLNFGGTSWVGFSDFPLAIKDLKENNKNVHLETNSQITLRDYNKFAGSGAYNWRYDRNVVRDSIICFDESGQKNLFSNVGYTAFLDARSLPGASGSPIVVFDETKNNFSIIGIFWGEITYSTGSLTYSLGAGTFFNVGNYNSSGIDVPLYDLVQYVKNYYSL